MRKEMFKRRIQKNFISKQSIFSLQKKNKTSVKDTISNVQQQKTFVLS